MKGTFTVPRKSRGKKFPVRVLLGDDPLPPSASEKVIVLRMNPVPTGELSGQKPFCSAVLGACRAVEWIAGHPLADATDITCCASGETGAIGYCLMGLCPRFRRGAIHSLAVPPSLGGAESVSAECAFFASRIKVPVLSVVGFLDDAVRPSNVLAAYNAIDCRGKRLVDGLGMAATVFPRLKVSMRDWLEDDEDKENREIRAVLLHLGYNMWCDWFPAGTDLSLVPERVERPDTRLRCRDDVWKTVTDRILMRKLNMIVLDIGEGLVFPSHPELAVEGSWSVAKLKGEIARLKAAGVEMIPKLNFSTTHNGWLKQYRRIVGTPAYRRVVEDLLKDVNEIFDHPRFCHIGYDEERESYSPMFEFLVVRKGQAWEQDFLHIVRACESLGMRPWAWSDYTWGHPDFLKRCPKSVVFSNWYYDENNLGYTLERNDSYDNERLRNFFDLRDAGFDQIPCGTNWTGLKRREPFLGGDDVIGRLAEFCHGNIPGGHLLGCMMASWADLGTEEKAELTVKGIDLLADALPHRFSGRWITDGELAAVEPRRVTCRQLQRNTLTPENTQLRNRHVLFRKSFDLSSVHEAHVYVTADDYYKLFVNGVFVGQGPAAGTPERTYYNEIDIAKYLKPGKNVLAVHTYYQGLVNRVWRSGDNRHGFILDLVADGKTIVKSDESFITARHGAFSALHEVGYSTGFMERYDASAKEVGFARPEFDDSEWKPATLHPHGGDYRLYPQPTAMLEFEEMRPLVCEKKADGTLWLDFGAVYVGCLTFAAKGPKGSEVKILCGQELNADGSVRHKMRCCCDYVEQFVLSGGARDILDQYDYKSFRYVELRPAKDVTIDERSIVLQARHMPFELKTKPNFGDDPVCRRIWDLCVGTFRWGVQEQIQDCMDREKGYYLGDGCYTMYANSLLTADWSGARRFFDDFLRTRDIDRGLVTCGNCSIMQEIAEYPFMLIFFARIYAVETGDWAFVADRFAAFADILDSYRERYGQTNGLLNHLDKWCLVEWPNNFQDGYDADVREGKVCTDLHNAVNAWYIGAIKCLNAIAVKLGRAPYADASRLEKAFVETFWDAGRNLFVDRAGSKHVSLPGNSYAALFGLAPSDKKELAHRAYLNLIREKRYSSISMFQFVPVFAYLKATGEKDLLHDLIVSPDAWLRILREGGTRTFEGWGKDTKWNTSLFHLTAASVVVFLTDSKIEQAIEWEKCRK